MVAARLRESLPRVPEARRAAAHLPTAWRLTPKRRATSAWLRAHTASVRAKDRPARCRSRLSVKASSHAPSSWYVLNICSAASSGLSLPRGHDRAHVSVSNPRTATLCQPTATGCRLFVPLAAVRRWRRVMKGSQFPAASGPGTRGPGTRFSFLPAAPRTNQWRAVHVAEVSHRRVQPHRRAWTDRRPPCPRSNPPDRDRSDAVQTARWGMVFPVSSAVSIHSSIASAAFAYAASSVSRRKSTPADPARRLRRAVVSSPGSIAIGNFMLLVLTPVRPAAQLAHQAFTQILARVRHADMSIASPVGEDMVRAAHPVEDPSGPFQLPEQVRALHLRIIRAAGGGGEHTHSDEPESATHFLVNPPQRG